LGGKIRYKKRGGRKVKRIGIDVGGTFTDIVIIDEDKGELEIDKVLSTPRDPSQAIIDYIERCGLTMEEVRTLTHGTTVATNAVIERKGARLGLITTVGQKDRLDIQRTNLLTIYDYTYQKPQALILGELRREVAGRTLYDGSILTPINEAEVLTIARDLIEAKGVEGICVCFLNSYINPTQEQQVKEIIKRKYSGTYVVTSSEMLAEVLEYERFSTTVISAFLMPEMDRYLRRLEDFLQGRGLAKEKFMLMQGNGGMISAAAAREMAALTVESGPAGGVNGSQYLGQLSNHQNIITFDMGGTSTDVCLIRDGHPYVTTDYKVVGHPMRFPLIDIHSIGAGGGSVAWIDEGGGLHVGPHSVGSDPGPACYGLGGELPTVSDAHAVLGRLRPEFLLGGKVQVKRDLAEKAINKIGSYYKMGTAEAAASIIKIVDENMANALRVISVYKGVDPHEFTLLAYGGAGPLHAGMMMKRLGIPNCIIPRVPGAHSAFGLITSDIKHDYVRSIVQPTRLLDIKRVHEMYQALENVAREALRAEGVEEKDMVFERNCDMRYIGQAYVPCIFPFASDAPYEKQLAETEKTFHRIHRELYKHAAETEPTEMISLRISAIGRQEKPSLRREKRGTKEPQMTKKEVYFEDIDQSVVCDAYTREELPVGFRFNGPAIVFQMDSTTLVYPKQTATVDEYGNMVLEEKL
jgi:N-methylhydantoinase A